MYKTTKKVGEAVKITFLIIRRILGQEYFKFNNIEYIFTKIHTSLGC